MARLLPLPHPSVRVIDLKTGLMTEDWYRYLSSREKAGTLNLVDVADTAPANGEVLIFNDTTGKFEPGAN